MLQTPVESIGTAVRVVNELEHPQTFNRRRSHLLLADDRLQQPLQNSADDTIMSELER